jgi:hypothetical protein
MKYVSSGNVCLKMAAELTAAKSILKHEWNSVQLMCTVDPSENVSSCLDSTVYNSTLCYQVKQIDVGP